MTFIVFSAGTAFADTNSDCLQSDSLDLKLTACTGLIDGGKLSGHDLAVAYYNRGIAYIRFRHDYDRAIADYDKAIARDPKFAAPYTGRGSAYMTKRQYQRILAELNSPKATPADGNRGKPDWSNDDFNRALADFTTAIDLDPKAAEAHSGRCVLLAAANRDLQRALSDCEQVVRLFPASDTAIERRGFVYLRLSRLDEAIADYDAALSVYAKSAYSLYGRGLAKQKKGDQAGGDTDLAAAKAIKVDIAEDFARFGIN